MSVATGVTVHVPATCGEILQGVGPDGPLLVSLPIDLTGTVQVTLTDEPVVAVAPDLPKARLALGLALQRVSWPGGAAVQLGGEVPVGRGMGSSTVDVAGVIHGVVTAAGVELLPRELVRLMTQVEPSDSSPPGGLWAIDHVGGRSAAKLGDVPANWWLVAVDNGAPVDTVALHHDRGAGPALPGGIIAVTPWHDPVQVARVATESALRNQERLPHFAFDAVFRCSRAINALGVCVAHSGSLCAVICQDAALAGEARSRLAAEGLRAELMRTSP